MSCHFVDLKLDDESDEVGHVKRKVKGGVDLDMGDLSNGTWGFPGRILVLIRKWLVVLTSMP